MASSASRHLQDLLGIDWPIVQAPMAGTSTPELAAAVANAGGLGSIGVGAMGVKAAGDALAAFRARSSRSLNINVFCHRPAQSDPARESAWLERLRPEFERVKATAPSTIREVYKSFVVDEPMFTAILAARPKVVSFHFGLPSPEWIRALREAGIVLLGTATNLAEARANVAAGVQVVVAQGYEAGGHRGIFDPDRPDDRLGTFALTRLLTRNLDVPVIAAGGIMDGQGIAAAIRLGAGAAQLGTAFVGTQESAADAGYRAALFSDAASHTVMTRAISGRPARCLANRFTALSACVSSGAIPLYPIAYDAGKSLNAAAKAVGENGFGAQWAGQGAPLARSLPAGKLMAALVEEMKSI
ncbi:MAG TPA: nitronate monooxygenase [Steroidobacteraceae bacterium]|jgi:nitronate monooxygenase